MEMKISSHFSFNAANGLILPLVLLASSQTPKVKAPFVLKRVEYSRLCKDDRILLVLSLCI